MKAFYPGNLFPSALGTEMAYTPTMSCITGFYRTIPGGYIYMYVCQYDNALLENINYPIGKSSTSVVEICVELASYM